MTEWKPSKVRRLETLWAKGLSASQVGKQLGCSRSAVCGKVDRLNLPSRVQWSSVKPPVKLIQPTVKPVQTSKVEPVLPPERMPRPTKPVPFTKAQLYEMLAIAAQNTAGLK
jgi:GcrA cell cycle regulator